MRLPCHISSIVFLTLSNHYAVWIVQEEEARAAREAKKSETLRLAEEAKSQREAMRKEAGLTPAGISSSNADS